MWIFLKVLWNASWPLSARKVILKLTFSTSGWEWSFTRLRPTLTIRYCFVAWHILTFLETMSQFISGKPLPPSFGPCGCDPVRPEPVGEAHILLAPLPWSKPKLCNKTFAYTSRNKTQFFFHLDLNYDRMLRPEFLALSSHYVELKSKGNTRNRANVWRKRLCLDGISWVLCPVIPEVGSNKGSLAVNQYVSFVLKSLWTRSFFIIFNQNQYINTGNLNNFKF